MVNEVGGGDARRKVTLKALKKGAPIFETARLPEEGFFSFFRK